MSDAAERIERELTTRSWWEEHERQRRGTHEEASAAFFATRSDIPDLEFLPPDCSICECPTDYDDGWFYCDVCRVHWPSTGYGHQARRDADEATS